MRQMYWNLIWKSPDLSHLGSTWLTLQPNLTSLQYRSRLTLALSVSSGLIAWVTQTLKASVGVDALAIATHVFIWAFVFVWTQNKPYFKHLVKTKQTMHYNHWTRSFNVTCVTHPVWSKWIMLINLVDGKKIKTCCYVTCTF